MSQHEHIERQRRFYETRTHGHLQVRDDDYYEDKLAGRLAAELGITRESRVLEVGAGFGRFTFPLLRHCDSVVALDLSRATLDKLDRAREERGIPLERCRPLVADLQSLGDLGERFEFILGFFLLHHLPNFADAIRRLGRNLQPGGGIGFLEPNRRNPLFLAQVACCADMTWAEEKDTFRLSRRRVERAYRDAALCEVRTRTCGFFPPQVLNRFPSARSLEARIERLPGLGGILPFLLLSARAPADAGPGSS